METKPAQMRINHAALCMVLRMVLRVVLWMALPALGLAACDPSRKDRALVSSEPAIVAPPANGTKAAVTVRGEPFHVRLFAFDLARSDLAVEDMGMRAALPGLVGDPSVLFALNGGFFEPSGHPRGLVEVRGKRLSDFDLTLSGGVLAVDGDVGALLETESYDASSRHGFAVQCRPRLVVGGEVHIRSDDGQRAERTVVCLRKKGREIVFGLMTSEGGGPSLLAAAGLLVAAGCSEALNLDGGPSSAIVWRDGSTIRSEGPRGPLRHAILVRDRSGAPR